MTTTSDVTTTSDELRVGDKVKPSVDIDTLKVMQEGHGGWNDEMIEVRCETYTIMSKY